MDQFIERFAKEWPVISGAPASFGIAVAIVGTSIWLALRWQYGARLTHRDDEIAAYRRKLDGASPDEAAQKIAALEKRLDSFTSVPIEELQRNLTHAEAVARQNQIRQLVDQYLETNTEPPADAWLNAQLEKLGKTWHAINKGTHYETFEPARWG
ncbi:hypothetical protein CN311_19215 [Mesorhizobium sanjuanii]|uniref:Uncharacterized protein n=1 Tax=Mesorhizobium sanjuanii TaxID=2037900 RepID=A0A2A6FCJ8_9HYPH|nr:hypothetical protein [Mesorhizobium sanjuanii]PDQ19482.1 hypothetical protein CN311_19215 [Mesorhizobium sanjuanii]